MRFNQNRLENILILATASAIGFFMGILGKPILYSMAYKPGNNYPSALTTHAQGVIVPHPDFLRGIYTSVIESEGISLQTYQDELYNRCQEIGLVEDKVKLSLDELIPESESIHLQMEDYYGSEKDTPQVEWELQKSVENTAGGYDLSDNSIQIYNPGDAKYILGVLIHEESHPWLGNETLNSLVEVENLIRMAKIKEYAFINDPADTNAGKMACLYWYGAAQKLIDNWEVIDNYQSGRDYSNPDYPGYKNILDYYLVPGLLQRYSAFDFEVTQPEIPTLLGYEIDISETVEMIKRVTYPEVFGEYDMIFDQ